VIKAALKFPFLARFIISPSDKPTHQKSISSLAVEKTHFHFHFERPPRGALLGTLWLPISHALMITHFAASAHRFTRAPSI
jgi:hypothetical protein